MTLIADRYELGDALGRGAKATVFRAWDTRLQREVAVKVFTTGDGSPEDGERRLREIRLLAGANHPHLVTLFDADWPAAEAAGAVGAGDGAPPQPGFLVMELVDGESLRRRIDRIGADPELAQRVVVELSAALAYLHERGIVHRDLKPENILVDGATGRLKLVDFGIAQLIGDEHLTATGAVLGTAAYLSPEQVAGAEVTAAADVYALALVALETLTGARAFPGSAIETAVARMTRDPAVPTELPEGWRELLAGMTARAPGERPSAATVAAQVSGLPALMRVAVGGAGDAETAVLSMSDQTLALEGATGVAGGAGMAGAAGAGATTGFTSAASGRVVSSRDPVDARRRRGSLAAAGATALVAAGALALALTTGQHPSVSAPAESTPSSTPAPTVTRFLPQPVVTKTVQPAAPPAGGGQASVQTGAGPQEKAGAPAPARGHGNGHGKGHGKH
ncbi:hypothetical protein GCM10022286_01220 [Gryllotalpicola daejeonensis]|uniref:non-specific serine/threonine protein kinase n=1 Tax=Gryllotalpicola daejeonensis TaxID=993087 RepID=A0ABP7ZD56_9MICO